jgi:hypothetical protein
MVFFYLENIYQGNINPGRFLLREYLPERALPGEYLPG